MIGRVSVAFILALVLVGCGPSESSIISSMQQKVLARLKDPDSARFRNIKYHKRQTENSEGAKQTLYGICGEVNAKNSMGGYIGFRGFIAFQAVDGENRKY